MSEASTQITTSTDSQIVRPSAPASDAIKHNFGSTELVQRETQGAALASRAQAEVQARYIMAERRPRNVEQARVRILEHCLRRGFAERAEYAKPVGNSAVRGPTIRFVETALQEFENVMPEETITYEDDYRRITRIAVTDLERNITYYGDTNVEKTVERKSPKKGDEVLGQRVNSYGDTVYKIRATEDDFANKVAAANSKKLRNLGLRILPADIVDEAMALSRRTREKADAQDPVAARRAISDAFAMDCRVMPADLDAYLGHAMDQASPQELDELRAAYAAVRDGETRWADLVEAARAARGEIEKASKPAEAAAAAAKSKLQALKDKRAAAMNGNGATPTEKPST